MPSCTPPLQKTHSNWFFPLTLIRVCRIPEHPSVCVYMCTFPGGVRFRRIYTQSRNTHCVRPKDEHAATAAAVALYTQKILLNFSEFAVFDQMYSKIGYRHSRMHSIPTDLLTVYSTKPILNPTVYFRNLRLFDADQRLANNQTTCPATTSLQIIL